MAKRKIIVVLQILILIMGLSACKRYEVADLTIPTKQEAEEMTKQPPLNAAGGYTYILPESYNLKLAVEKNLCGITGFGEKYLYMQALYRRALEQYFMDALSLKKFDDQIKNHELNFLPVSEAEKEFYQKYSTMPLAFIYLRNNLPIERLGKEDLAVLEQSIGVGRADITEELTELVMRTYPIVLKGRADRDDGNPASYAVTDEKNAPNLSVVFEVRFTLFDETGDFADVDNNKSRMDYIEGVLIPEMAGELSKQLDFTVVVFYEC